mgnify:CR=1 FL=1
MMKENLIAPCGMDCRLCVAYQFMQRDLNKQGFHKTYCPGCIPRGKNCLFMGHHCALLKDGKVRFCYECNQFPCKRLKALDKRYKTKYNMSMIENLRYIQCHGMDRFLEHQQRIWRCPTCDDLMCCHVGLCLGCDMQTLIDKKKSHRSR